MSGRRLPATFARRRVGTGDWRNSKRGAGMRIRKPSPSLVISIVALVMASTGSAVAAVSFARNAGAVDHKSAVGSGATLSHAAGKLVATRAKGAGKGTIAAKYLDLGGVAHGSTSTFGQSVP